MRSRPRPGEAPVPRGVRLYDPATLARLCRARDYLGDRFNRRTSLEDAARQASLSPFYFNRLFAEVFGETPHEFVTRLRTDRAKRLLLADRGSVTDICFDVGYASLGSFSTRFRSLTGLSPAAFRREARRVFGFRRWRLFVTPPFPEYTSGHSTFSSAGAAVLASFFGSNDIPFTTESEDLPGVVRSFTSFSGAAAEAGMSRIYGGIHFLSANEAGLSSGAALGAFVSANFLRDRPGRSKRGK